MGTTLLALISRHSVMPSMRGSITSSRTRSGCRSPKAASPARRQRPLDLESVALQRGLRGLAQLVVILDEEHGVHRVKHTRRGLLAMASNSPRRQTYAHSVTAV